MIKAIVWLVGLAMAFTCGALAFRYAKRENLWITPFNFALMAWALTLCALILLIVFLDQIGWYPD